MAIGTQIRSTSGTAIAKGKNCHEMLENRRNYVQEVSNTHWLMYFDNTMHTDQGERTSGSTAARPLILYHSRRLRIKASYSQGQEASTYLLEIDHNDEYKVFGQCQPGAPLQTFISCVTNGHENPHQKRLCCSHRGNQQNLTKCSGK